MIDGMLGNTFLQDKFPLPPQVPPPKRMQKLARSQMTAYKHKLHKEQNGTCPLCQTQIDLSIKGEGVIDHDHDTGQIRGLLHRSCNAAEGKVANGAGRWGCKSMRYCDIVPYLERLVAYLKKEPKDVLYPMHKTAEEVADLRKLRAKNQRATIAAKRKLARATKENHGE